MSLPIKEAIRQAEKRLQELNELPKKTPAYSVYMEAQKAWRKVENAILTQTKNERESLWAEISEWKELLREKEAGLDLGKYSNELEVAYTKIYEGTTHYVKKRLMWVSPDEDYFLVKVPGYSTIGTWGNKGYYPTQWDLFRTSEVSGGGLHCYGRVINWEGGRMNMNRWKVVFQAMNENWISKKY